MSEEPESINVQRRRKGGGPSGRAEAPTRRDAGQGGDGGGYSPRPSGGRIPAGPLGGCGTVIIVILLLVFYFFSNQGGDTSNPPLDDGSNENTTDPTDSPFAEPDPTNTPRPTRAPSSGGQGGGTGDSWLVLLYQDADDQVLEQDIFLDLNEAERVGSSDKVTILAQADRYKGAFRGDGNWTSARRYLVQQDDDLNAIHSEMLEDLGEVNMAQSQTLVDFVTWGVQNYPADHYVLILSDHGMGWPGGFSDPAPSSRDPGSAPLVGALDEDFLFLSELDEALGQIRQQTGIEKFDMIGMDACLMSQLEVYAALQPHAHYAVASEETEPALGWAYASFLQSLVDNPNMSAEELSADVVQSYIAQDQRIVDDEARQDFLRDGSSLGGFFNGDVGASQLAKQISRDVTLTAVNLDALPDLMQRYNEFTYQLQSEDQALVASARNYAQSYTSIFGEDVPPSFIDLGHFAQLVAKQTGSKGAASAAKKLMTALNAAIVAEKHGPVKPGSTGIAIYFPNSKLYRSPYTGLQSYTEIASRFASESLWDDFLAFHYAKRPFELDDAQAVVPASGAATRAPGAGDLSISAITTSSDSADPNHPVKLSAEIGGSNIGYAYLMIGLYDEQSNAILMADSDYLESSKTLDLNGVYYPQWPTKNFVMNFEWDVSVFSLSDGSTNTLALFAPENYGASADDATYLVEGTYTFADSGEQKYAQLRFQDGKLIQVLGYNGDADAGAPAEISPKEGDTFTVLRKWLELDAQGNVSKTVTEPGDTLTFGDTPFTWEQVYAPEGDYVVGFIVKDYDGNQKAAYANIVVK